MLSRDGPRFTTTTRRIGSIYYIRQVLIISVYKNYPCKYCNFFCFFTEQHCTRRDSCVAGIFSLPRTKPTIYSPNERGRAVTRSCLQFTGLGISREKVYPLFYQRWRRSRRRPRFIRRKSSSSVRAACIYTYTARNLPAGSYRKLLPPDTLYDYIV